jgi:hypothetical protein
MSGPSTEPSRQIGVSTEDIANLAVFLASDESNYMHDDLVRVGRDETLCRYSV